mmetsp:Transcript_94402/g.281758  ORF Transcript_94402/g.281758 Transcript_94402/m.281758 type:complete len:289 (+) Transcript_94402:109-975(+)
MRAARPLAAAAAAHAGPPTLEGSVAWVVGGAGVIGRGICRGLLRAGATVIVNSDFPKTLSQMEEDLNYPAGLITLRGSMNQHHDGLRPLLEQALEMPQLAGRQIQHVVAHSGVRWWAKDGATFEQNLFRKFRMLSLMKMGHQDFAHNATRVTALHLSAAQMLMPQLQRVAGATYTFVNGGLGRNRTAIDQINIHGMWGLAAAMREEFRDSPVRVEELRVTLAFDRLAREKELDPRPTPLSHDIGDICAGMAVNAVGWPPNPVFQAVDSYDHILMLKTRYPAEVVVDIG